MQLSVPAIADLSTEPAHILKLYGADDTRNPDKAAFARNCILARRLIERGVRFVQIYSGGGHQQQNWDAHNGVEENLRIHCPEIDRPIHALLEDLDRVLG